MQQYIFLDLKKEFYGLEPTKLVFHERIVKEAIHELGHTFSLFHCNDKLCVMHFSNSLHDTDTKGKVFCLDCKHNLRLKLND